MNELDVASSLHVVWRDIADAARSAGRDPKSVKLIAVSKTVPAEAIEEAIASGQRRFGENRVQEAKAKYPALKERYPDLELHLIGPLQSNKVRDAVQLFNVIHSVDRSKIAATLAARTNRIAEQAGRLGLIASPAGQRAGHFLGLRFPGGLPKGLPERLAASNVFVSVRGDSLRVTPHLYNDDEDIDRLLAALANA